MTHRTSSSLRNAFAGIPAYTGIISPGSTIALTTAYKNTHALHLKSLVVRPGDDPDDG